MSADKLEDRMRRKMTTFNFYLFSNSHGERFAFYSSENGEKIITVPMSKISIAVGQKRCNVRYIKEKYGIDIEVKEI